MYKITPSIYTCDTTRINEELQSLKHAGINWIHFDIMDGEFVPNYAMGPKQIDDIKLKFPELTIDAHIMANNILDKLSQFKTADYVTFHFNSIQENGKENLIKAIRKNNNKVGIALDLDNTLEDIKPYFNQIDLITIMSIKPGFTGQKFEPQTWDLIKAVVKYRDQHHPNVLIQIDGGVRWENIYQLIESKIDLIVVGSLLFQEKDYSNVMYKIANKKLDKN